MYLRAELLTGAEEPIPTPQHTTERLLQLYSIEDDGTMTLDEMNEFYFGEFSVPVPTEAEAPHQYTGELAIEPDRFSIGAMFRRDPRNIADI